MNVCSNLGYVQNKPLKEKIPRKKRKNQEGDEPDGLENHEVCEDITQQQELEQPQPYQPGILDEIDFEPQDGDSSGAAGSFSFSEEQPERLRDGSSADGSMRAPSKQSSRMSVDSFEFNKLNFDGEESATKSATSRRSKLSILGDGPFELDDESLFPESSLSLRVEPESHPSLADNYSQLPLSQVRLMMPLIVLFF